MRDDFAERLHRTLQSFEQTREQLAEVETRVREAHGSAASADRLIMCTVGAGGGISELTINPRALQHYDAARLAATIRAVIEEAQARLRATVLTEYRTVLGDSFDPAALADPHTAATVIQERARRLAD